VAGPFDKLKDRVLKRGANPFDRLKDHVPKRILSMSSPGHAPAMPSGSPP